MTKKHIVKMIFKIILPPILVIILFVVSIGMVIIPETEKALMAKKRDTIQAIVSSAISIINKHHQRETEGRQSPKESKINALEEMRALRYGIENKDYLWIIDLKPAMLMHPYFPELEGKSLTNYKDLNGKLLFVEAVNLAKKDKNGFIDYMWPKQDNSNDIEEKLSYIKLFEPWGWIVGSGIYLNDVRSEINKVTLRLLFISGIIGVAVFLLLSLIIYRGWKSENEKLRAQAQLIKTSERYEALAHASEEVLFLTIDNLIAGVNKKACEILNIDEEDIINHKLEEFIYITKGKSFARLNTIINFNIPSEIYLKGNTIYHKVLMATENVVVHNSPAIMYTGHIVKLNTDSEIETIIYNSLDFNEFGIITIDNISNGKILSINQTATKILTNDENKNILDSDVRNYFNKSDALRLFIELDKESKSDNTIIKIEHNNQTIHTIKIWATLIKNSISKRTQIVMIFKLIDVEILSNISSELILSEYLSPMSKLDINNSYPSNSPKKSIKSYDFRINFQKAKLILKHSAKIGMYPLNTISYMTNEVESVIKYAVKKAIESLGQPPVSYSFIAFGSIGRSECTFFSDQDTAIIYKDTDNPEHHEYFKKLGRLISTKCSLAGIPECNADNHSGNPKWCMSENGWKNQFSKWIQKSTPDDLIKINIFFDFRNIVGDEKISRNLHAFIFETVRENQGFLYNLAQNIVDYKPPSDIFGRIRTDNSKFSNYFNLKSSMLHYVNFVRLYSLKHNVFETNTINRLNSLLEGGYIPNDIYQDTYDAWNYLMEIRIKTQICNMESNFRDINSIIIDELTSWDKSMLKKAASHVINLQNKLSSDILRLS